MVALQRLSCHVGMVRVQTQLTPLLLHILAELQARVSLIWHVPVLIWHVPAAAARPRGAAGGRLVIPSPAPPTAHPAPPPHPPLTTLI
eukprot:943325-Prymnesium_polylepis.1